MCIPSLYGSLGDPPLHYNLRIALALSRAGASVFVLRKESLTLGNSNYPPPFPTALHVLPPTASTLLRALTGSAARSPRCGGHDKLSRV